jgi:hypothetical protein
MPSHASAHSTEQAGHAGPHTGQCSGGNLLTSRPPFALIRILASPLSARPPRTSLGLPHPCASHQRTGLEVRDFGRKRCRRLRCFGQSKVERFAASSGSLKGFNCGREALVGSEGPQYRDRVPHTSSIPEPCEYISAKDQRDGVQRSPCDLLPVRETPCPSS